VYAYFSGFKAQTTVGDGYFGIGLDLFLGANSRFYPGFNRGVSAVHIKALYSGQYCTAGELKA
jgi:hypothetical protein